MDLSSFAEKPTDILHILKNAKKVVYYYTEHNCHPFELISLDEIGIMGYRLERQNQNPGSGYRRDDSGRPVIIPWHRITEIQLTVEDVL